MVLAAGQGTRLAPLTDHLPKALVPIGDRPALARVLERLARSGARRAAVNVHHLPGAFTPDVLAALPLPVDVVHEPALLGTAGGIANALPVLQGEIVVAWNADIVADVDVGLLVERVQRAEAALAVVPRAVGQGTVGLGASGDVVRLRGERFGDELSGGDFLGIQAVGPAARARLPRAGCLVGDVYLPALRAGARIATVGVDVAWDDIGSIGGYLSANARWLTSRALESYVAGSAVVGPDVRLERTVVGAGASVEGSGTVRDVVVWPGARAAAPLERAVAFGGGVARA